mmetsp:Transcript_18949/g.38928  ORF Transcript_18949/g.38928 Transcript_18949/m.38928 type:complete len:102 (-) Transcript_18949:143-448(-)
MIAHLCDSGSNSLRIVPMDGKYIPTQASKVKKAIMIDNRFPVWMACADHEKTTDETNNIPVRMCFWSTNVLRSWPNITEPMRQQAMKHEKMVPNGITAASP